MLPDEDFRLQVIHGVLEYIRREPTLRLDTRGGVPYVPWDELKDFRGDGLIASAYTRRAVHRLACMRLPVVNVSSHFPQDDLPSVATDDAALGRLAAKHLLDRGLRKMACIYYRRLDSNTRRLAAFCDEVQQAGASVTPVAASLRRPVGHLEVERLELDTAKLARSLAKLPWPVGIFAVHDEFAAAAVEASRMVGASLPYDLAILGAANNRLICSACDPPLSSIEQPGDQIGFEAASMLHRLLRGEELTERHLRLPPVKIAVRRSTDVMATRDQIVLEALEQIQLRCGEPFTVEELAALMSVSRSGLYKRFMNALGCTPNDEIRRAR
ncbi:substrate-binding domain-containing protein, partial [Pirellulales bacterium]|nr:substrate-binding domain-containing protein [Pirellulales bacterium]